MCRILKILIYLYLCAGVQCARQMSCVFTDERVFQNNDNQTVSETRHRNAVLQFGQKGDAPVNPDTITFLVTGSKVNLQRYVEGVEPEQLECELRRYSTRGIHVRWPVQGANEFNRWFSCTLKHNKGLFTVTSLLRHPSDDPSSGQQDYHSWIPITDREILTTTPVMVIKTETPSMTLILGAKEKLHCQFAVDHKGPDITVEWYLQRRGERIKLFSHNSRSGQTQGKGVELQSLAGGDASYTLSNIKMSSEGKYVCSVSVNPLFTSLDISLNIEEAPSVSLNVEPNLLLLEDTLQRVACEAKNYYPLDVDIVWYKQPPPVSGQGFPVPEKLKNVQQPGHKHNRDQTYSMSSFFYLKPSLSKSGTQFTCIVSHQSLTAPIKKSFILTVENPTSWTLMFIVMLVAVLYFVLLFLRRARRKSRQRNPY